MDLDRKDLKIQALLEKISSLTTQYENQIADLRVELTLVAEEAAQAQSEKVEDVKTSGKK
jgi:hypothetical protein